MHSIYSLMPVIEGKPVPLIETPEYILKQTFLRGRSIIWWRHSEKGYEVFSPTLVHRWVLVVIAVLLFIPTRILSFYLRRSSHSHILYKRQENRKFAFEIQKQDFLASKKLMDGVRKGWNTQSLQTQKVLPKELLRWIISSFIQKDEFIRTWSCLSKEWNHFISDPSFFNRLVPRFKLEGLLYLFSLRSQEAFEKNWRPIFTEARIEWPKMTYYIKSFIGPPDNFSRYDFISPLMINVPDHYKDQTVIRVVSDSGSSAFLFSCRAKPKDLEEDEVDKDLACLQISFIKTTDGIQCKGRLMLKLDGPYKLNYPYSCRSVVAIRDDLTYIKLETRPVEFISEILKKRKVQLDFGIWDPPLQITW